VYTIFEIKKKGIFIVFEKIVKILEYVITIVFAIILVFIDKLPEFFPKISPDSLLGIELLLIVGLISMIWLNIKGIRKEINIANDKNSGISHGNLNQLLSDEIGRVNRIDTFRVFASTTGKIQPIVATSLNATINRKIGKCYILVHQIHGNSNTAKEYNRRLFQILESWYQLKREGLIDELYVKVFEELPDFLPTNYNIIINDDYMIYGLLGTLDDITRVRVNEPSVIRGTTVSNAKFINKHVAWFDAFWSDNNERVNKSTYSWLSNDEIQKILITFQALRSATEIRIQELDRLSQRIQRIIIQQYNNMAETYVVNRGMDAFQQELCDNFFNNYILNACKQSRGFNHKLKLLDIGSGSGRDLLYYTEKSQENGNIIELHGIELCKDLYYHLKNLEDMKIIDAEILEKDMQDLSCYGDESFHIVQHKATLIHMPIVGPGYTVHKCLSESYRVLKSAGILYLTVRESETSHIVLKNSGSGIGFRIFQMYSQEDIIELVETSGFVIDNIRILNNVRNDDEREVRWVEVIAHKA